MIDNLLLPLKNHVHSNSWSECNVDLTAGLEDTIPLLGHLLLDNFPGEEEYLVASPEFKTMHF